MRARRVLRRTLLGHDVQVGFQIRAVGPGRSPSRLRWRVAHFVDDHAPVVQCWSDLVDWVFRYGALDQPLRDLRPVDLLPWRPLPQGCRDSARECGTCYCGRAVRADLAAEHADRNTADRPLVIVPTEPEVASWS